MNDHNDLLKWQAACSARFPRAVDLQAFLNQYMWPLYRERTKQQNVENAAKYRASLKKPEQTPKAKRAAECAKYGASSRFVDALGPLPRKEVEHRAKVGLPCLDAVGRSWSFKPNDPRKPVGEGKWIEISS
jgi:hypothetical protein